ncbi:MAG: hypothetical protein V1907_00545 [Candidatus Kerfeldbacteria bacterium]
MPQKGYTVRWYHYILVDAVLLAVILGTAKILGFCNTREQMWTLISASLLGILVSYLVTIATSRSRKRRRPLLRIEPWVDKHGNVQEPERRMNPGRW